MNKVPLSGDYSNSLNMFVFDEVPKGSVCLDVGCWTGNLGKALITQKACIVEGIDVNTAVLMKAKNNGYIKTYKLNLNNDTYTLNNIKTKYDVIIFADILEHLVNPEQVLKEFKRLLKPKGKIIISLPNVGFILNRLLLLFGNWEYREFGCFDKTHLRFYTVDSVAKMVHNSGYKVTKLKPYNQFGMLRHLNKVNNLYPRLFAYQTLLVATPKKT